MNSCLTNENILKLVLINIKLYEVKHILDRIRNKSVTVILLKLLDITKIYQHMNNANTYEIQDNFTNSLALLPNNYIISALYNSSLEIWNIKNYTFIATLKGHQGSVNSVVFLTDYNIASCCYNGQIKIWSGEDDYKCLNTLQYEGYTFFDILLVLNNENIACTAMYQNAPCIIILDYYNDYSLIKVLKDHKSRITSLVNINDMFASGSGDMTIKIWDPAMNYKCIRSLDVNEGWVFSLLFVAKEGLLISGSYRTIKVWNISDNYTCIKLIEAHNAGIRCLLLLPNGFFVSSSSDGKIKIWNLKTFLCINILEQEKEVTSLLLLEDYRIVSAADKIIIWNY
jgi:WD40 repeat protein